MNRWILPLLLSAALTGCDRQVSITESGLDFDAIANADSSASGGADGTQGGGSPAVLEPGAQPVIDDSSPVVTPATTPATTPNDAPADPAVPGSSADASVSEVTVRLSEPAGLGGIAPFGLLTPVLIGPDGNRIEMNCCDESNAYTAIVPLNQESQWRGTIQWQIDIGDEPVPLLQADVIVEGSSGDAIDITPPSYNRDVDSDGDGIDNVTELFLGSSPFNVTDANPMFLSATVRIPRVASDQVPTIDGDVGEYIPGTTQLSGEWENAVHADVNGNRLSMDNLMFDLTGVSGAENHHWMALHDGTFLYVLVIMDDAGNHHFDSQEIAKPWRDDSIELFFDADNSMNSSYDGVDDFSMHLVLLDTAQGGVNSSSNANPKIYPSVNSIPLPPSVVFATGPLKGPAAPEGFSSNGALQDVYEIAFRISDLNIEMARTFGFEVQFDDDDNAGDRDAKWGWFHPEGTTSDNDFSWRDPRFMGRAVLLP